MAWFARVKITAAPKPALIGSAETVKFHKTSLALIEQANATGGGE
jgi:hypothetical protein